MSKTLATSEIWIWNVLIFFIGFNVEIYHFELPSSDRVQEDMHRVYGTVFAKIQYYWMYQMMMYVW